MRPRKKNMKIEVLPIKTLRITEIEKLDPITLGIDNENGKLTVEVYGQAWSAYWSSAKGSVLKFFLSCDNDYLIRCLDRQIKCSVTDFDAVPAYIKKLILRGRRDCDFSAADAREMFDSLEYESFESIEHVWRFSLKSIGEEWKHDLPETTSHDWLYLDRIVTAIKEAFALETK